MVGSGQCEACSDVPAPGGCWGLCRTDETQVIASTRRTITTSVVSVVHDAARFEFQRTEASVGVYVRDAACYAVQVVARAYDLHDVEPFAPLIIQAMVPVALLDREVKCRLAASAALLSLLSLGCDDAKNEVALCARTRGRPRRSIIRVIVALFLPAVFSVVVISSPCGGRGL